jgi:hypothetical protein
MLLYDASVEEELLDIPGVLKMNDCQHLWDLDVNGNLIQSIHWDLVYTNIALGLDVTLGIEPDVHPTQPHPTDPEFASLSEIRITHQILAQLLEPVCKAARRSGSQVWTYRLLSPTYQRVEDIVNNPTRWQQQVRDLVNLQYAPNKTIAKLLHSTGGGELCECYVDNGHNIDQPWAFAKCCLNVERQIEMMESLGLRALPVLRNTTVGVNANILADIFEGMIDTAGSYGRVVFWNGPIALGFPAISVANHDIVESFV